MSTFSDPIVVACAADEGYAMPLAVTVQSICDSLGQGRLLDIYVLDGGLSQQSKSRLAACCGRRARLIYLTPDLGLVSQYPVSHHISSAAYLRLLLPELLPANVSRAIYIDADMLVRRDLGQLWDATTGDEPIHAVQDMAAPWIDAQVSARDYAASFPYLSATWPVANYRELGLSPRAAYFNSGLLVMNIARWRREALAAQVFACLEEHRQHVLWWDQYATNVVFADRWGRLDERWNQGAHVFAYPSWHESPLDRDTFERLKRDPWVIHYCSPSKPWQLGCDHPYRSEFFRVLDRTAWRGWRPPGTPTTIRLAIKQRRKRLKKALQSAGRRVITAASQLFRRAA